MHWVTRHPVRGCTYCIANSDMHIHERESSLNRLDKVFTLWYTGFIVPALSDLDSNRQTPADITMV